MVNAFSVVLSAVLSVGIYASEGNTSGLTGSLGTVDKNDVMTATSLGVTILVEIVTDDHPMETSWSLRDTCPGGSEVVVGGGYTEKGKLEQKSILTRKSRYLFHILDLGGDGVCCNTGPKGSFKVFHDSTLEVEGGKFDYTDFGYFGDDVCTDTTSKPTNVLTASPTNNPTNVPTSVPTAGNMVPLRINIFFDNFPEDISWKLTNTCKGSEELGAGSGYSKDYIFESVDVFKETVLNGRFEFVIEDAYGDGLCCGQGPGGYTIFYGNEQIISNFTATPEEKKEKKTFGSIDKCLFQSTNKASYDSSLGAPKCGTVHSSGICTTTGTGLLTKRKIWGELNGPNTLDKCTDGSSGLYLNDESVESITVTAIGGGVLKAGGEAQVTARVHAFSQENMVDFYYSSTPGTNPDWKSISSTQPSSSKFSEVNSAVFFLPKTGTQAVRAIIRWTLENGNVAPCPGGGFSDVDDLVFVVDTSSASLSYDLPVGPVEMPLPMPQVECAGFVSGRCVAANTCKWDGKDCSPMN